MVATLLTLATALALLAAAALLLLVWKADTWIPALLERLDAFLTRHGVGTWSASLITRSEAFFAGRRRRTSSDGSPPA